jgi:hypothetical protein
VRTVEIVVLLVAVAAIASIPVNRPPFIEG